MINKNNQKKQEEEEYSVETFKWSLTTTIQVSSVQPVLS